jgi:hypothetical protein
MTHMASLLVLAVTILLGIKYMNLIIHANKYIQIPLHHGKNKIIYQKRVKLHMLLHCCIIS